MHPKSRYVILVHLLSSESLIQSNLQCFPPQRNWPTERCHRCVERGEPCSANLTARQERPKHQELPTAHQPGSSTKPTNVLSTASGRHASDENIKNQDDSPLMSAIHRNNEAMVKMLLEAGADPEERDERPCTFKSPLLYAVCKKHGPIVKMLLEARADPNQSDAVLGTCLEIAASEGLEPLVVILLQHGADVNAQGVCYRNALQAASANNHLEMVALLLENGAHPSKKRRTIPDPVQEPTHLSSTETDADEVNQNRVAEDFPNANEGLLPQRQEQSAAKILENLKTSTQASDLRPVGGFFTSIENDGAAAAASWLQNSDTPPTQPVPSNTSPKEGSHPATFECKTCAKRFTHAYNFRSHLRTHTDERPFLCDVCGKTFARRHDRNNHETIHSKDFVCRGPAGQGCVNQLVIRRDRYPEYPRYVHDESTRTALSIIDSMNDTHRSFDGVETARSSRSESTGSNVSDTFGTGTEGAVRPPVSAGANTIMTDGARYPHNPYARPHPPVQATESNTQLYSGHNTFETPVSAQLSNFVADGPLPSPSSFYPEWDFSRELPAAHTG